MPYALSATAAFLLNVPFIKQNLKQHCLSCEQSKTILPFENSYNKCLLGHFYFSKSAEEHILCNRIHKSHIPNKAHFMDLCSDWTIFWGPLSVANATNIFVQKLTCLSVSEDWTAGNNEAITFRENLKKAFDAQLSELRLMSSNKYLNHVSSSSSGDRTESQDKSRPTHSAFTPIEPWETISTANSLIHRPNPKPVGFEKLSSELTDFQPPKSFAESLASFSADSKLSPSSKTFTPSESRLQDLTYRWEYGAWMRPQRNCENKCYSASLNVKKITNNPHGLSFEFDRSLHPANKFSHEKSLFL